MQAPHAPRGLAPARARGLHAHRLHAAWVTPLVLLALAPASHAAPPPPTRPRAPLEEPRPFPRGSFNAGLAFGLSTGQQTSVTLGGDFGYFVLPGLEPGLELHVTFGGGSTVTSLLPYLRWVIWRSYTISPYLKAQAGRLFISDAPDLTSVGGGGGFVFFLTSVLGLQLEGMVYRLLPEEACPSNGCTATSFGLSLGFYFGGRRPSLPPPPLPSPAPAGPQPGRDEPGAY